MAGNEEQPFQRLRLDTSGWQLKPSQHDIDTTGIPVPAAQVLGRVAPPSPVAATRIPEEVVKDDEFGLPEDGVIFNRQIPTGTLESRPDAASRRTSIAFDPTITLDDGRRQSVDQSVTGRDKHRKPRGRSMMQELQAAKERSRTHSESDRTRFDPETGAPISNETKHENYIRGEQRWPLLQQTTDELADEHGNLRASLTSLTSMNSVTSSSIEAMHSPCYFAGDYSLSPSAASSPIQSFPTLNDSGVLQSPRTRDRQRRRTGATDRSSMRRMSRRSSARAVPTQNSPASSFLSKWNSAAAITPEPDEDGQTIGDLGEYIIGRQIGYGGFSVIKEIYSLENHQQMMRAVKIVRKQVHGKNEEENEKLQNEFEHEISIWRHLKHEFILPLVAVFSTPLATFCIMEMNTGGTLFDLVRSRRRKSSSNYVSDELDNSLSDTGLASNLSRHDYLPLELVNRYLSQLASAIRYLHQDMRVVHRDIKLENCLVSTQSTNLEDEPEAKIRLCDFGMADFIDANGREGDIFDETSVGLLEANSENEKSPIIGPSGTSTNFAGSLQYASPELLKASRPLYSPAADMWAFGVVAYALFTADLPFRHAFLPKLRMMILKGDWDRNALVEACGGSPEAMELVESCLEKELEERWKINDVLSSRLLKRFDESWSWL